MRATLLLAALAIAAPVRERQYPAPEAPRAVADQIIGDWVVVSFMQNGVGDADREGASITFTKTEFRARERSGRPMDISAYCIDGAGVPARIDFMRSEDAQTFVPGIALIQGDELTLCFPFGGGERPVTFASPPESNIALVVLRRTPPK